VRKTGVSKVPLKPENIQQIVDTLIYDAKLESIEDPRGTTYLVSLANI